MPPPINKLGLGLESCFGSSSSEFPKTWEEAKKFIPHDQAAHGVLEICKRRGYSIPDAVLYTLTLIIEGKEVADKEYQENKEKENARLNTTL